MGIPRVGETKQFVEFAWALLLDAGVLIMDEPTFALSVGEAERKLQVTHRTAARWVAVVYGSYRIEVFILADTLTELCDGTPVSIVAARETTRLPVIRSIVGRVWGVLLTSERVRLGV